MKVAIYSPYLDTLGGGERYIATIAEILSKEHDVDLLFDEHLQSFGMETLRGQLSERFNVDLSRINLIKASIGKGSNIFDRLFFLRKYDLLIYLTDGSIFIPTAGKNILHIQTPLAGQANTLWGKLKLKAWDLIIYNSEFTKKHSEKFWSLHSQVIYPPVDVDKIKPLKKKKYILSVGRFFGFLKDKKHELIIKSFKNLNKDVQAKGWSLHLVGSASSGDRTYLDDLKEMAKGLDVNFYPNLGYDDLVKLYGESSIYWHATGYGERDVTKMEHFGIATVEAMAAGCVPVVIGKGGQKEIVEDGESGYLWQTEDELSNLTLRLIADANIFKKISRQVIKRAKNFSKEKFERQILSLINK